MKVFLEFENTFMGNQLLLEEAITNSSLTSFQWLKDFINNKFNDTLQSIQYNGQIVSFLTKEVNKNHEIFFLVRPHLESYANKVIKQLKKDLQTELLTVLSGENFNTLIDTAREGENYHFIGSSIFQYYNFVKADKISFSTDIVSYILLYVIFFGKIKSCNNNYFNGMLAIVFHYRYIFLPLFIFWPVCLGFNINKTYIMPLFKSIVFSLTSFSLLANFKRIDHERYMLQNYDLEPLCDTGFLTQRYSLRFGILYFIITLILALKELLYSPFSASLGCMVGLVHYYLYFKNEFVQFVVMRIVFAVVNIICMQYY